VSGSLEGRFVVRTLDLVGAVVAVVLFVSSIMVFLGRLMYGNSADNWIGVPFLLMAFPLGYLLYMAPRAGRPFLYYLQIVLMLTAIVVLFLLDYVFRAEWRQKQWMVVGFVMLYFAGLGGMIGVASQAGRAWTISAVILFLVTAALAFISRSVTGL
jgi:hypothetical protein